MQLPVELINYILECTPKRSREGIKSLMSCREVCIQWCNIIDESVHFQCCGSIIVQHLVDTGCNGKVKGYKYVQYRCYVCWQTICDLCFRYFKPIRNKIITCGVCHYCHNCEKACFGSTCRCEKCELICDKSFCGDCAPQCLIEHERSGFLTCLSCEKMCFNTV